MTPSITVFLPDGTPKTLPVGCMLSDVAAAIGPGLAKQALAGKINGVHADLSEIVPDQAKIEIITPQSAEGLEILRHSTAHVMAMAIQKLFPGTQITIGPVVENGFYYDVLPPEGKKITPDDFTLIEQEMQNIVQKDIKVTKKVVSRAQATTHFQSLGEVFKVEIVQTLPDAEDIKIYEIGEWGDLCRGPHVPSTGKLGAFKLMSIAGAYWRANKDNAQLTRVYATAFQNKKELDAYLNMLEEAKKRDHVLLGRQLDLFSIHPEIAVGAPFFHPNGAKLFTLLQGYIRKQLAKYHYKEIHTPQVMNVELWKISGHYENYKENMYFTQVDDNEYAIKPMSCPAHVKVFATGQRSYRDLPIRYSEFGVVHRNELSGVVHGLTRVRRITQDDGHIFCTPDQVESEIRSLLKLIQESYRDLGFSEASYFLSTRPEKRIGADELWDAAERGLDSALSKEGIKFQINDGDGAFYGPKIDIKIRDAIGRFHQCATVQLDFQTPGRFKASYVSSQNTFETPVMIHRAILGSVERFMGIFIEHHAGHFPIGLCPVQAKVININDAEADYARSVAAYLEEHGVRVEADLANETLNSKIRNAQMKKIPYMLIIGAREAESKKVTPRYKDGKNLAAVSPEEFLSLIKKESGVFWGIDSNQT